MAGTSKSSWRISSRGAEQPETPATVEAVHSVNRLRRGLSRTITQPLGLYQSLFDTFGSTTTDPDTPEVEAGQVEEAFQNLQVSDVSDTGTGSSHEDDRAENHRNNPVDDRSEGSAAWTRHDHSGHDLRTGQKTKAPKLSDEVWAKSILGRSTGYGCLQRNQVVKYISQLESNLTEVQTEVEALNAQVDLYDQHRWNLQAENDGLKQKIEVLSRYHLIKEGQQLYLENELQLLRTQQAEQLLLQQGFGGSASTSEGEPNSIFSTDTRARVIQLREHDSALSDVEATEKESDFKGSSNETSRDQSEANSWSRPSSGLRQDEEQATKRLVKWPSSLYRSVSAIRRDVLSEIVVQETKSQTYD